jgi:hypothetical protein
MEGRRQEVAVGYASTQYAKAGEGSHAQREPAGTFEVLIVLLTPE